MACFKIGLAGHDQALAVIAHGRAAGAVDDRALLRDAVDHRGMTGLRLAVALDGAALEALGRLAGAQRIERAWPSPPVACCLSQSAHGRRRCAWEIADRAWSWRLWIASRSARSAALAWAYSSFLVTRTCCARPSPSIAMRTLRPQGDAAEVRRIITGVVHDDSNVGEQSAIDADDRGRDVRGLEAREERDHIGVLLRLAVAADRDAGVALGGHVGHRAAFALGLLFVEELDAARGHAAGQHDVAGDAVLAHFARQGLRPAQQRHAQSVRQTEVDDGCDHARRSAGHDAAELALAHAGQHAIGDGDN